MEATNVTGPSFSTFSVWSRALRYCTNLRRTDKKCSARLIFPGTASFNMSLGKAGLASQASPTARWEMMLLWETENQSWRELHCHLKQMYDEFNILGRFPLCARPSTSRLYSARNRPASVAFNLPTKLNYGLKKLYIFCYFILIKIGSSHTPRRHNAKTIRWCVCFGFQVTTKNRFLNPD